MNAREIFALGYTDLVCVVPPGATLSANSKLHADELGKTPGKRGANGWYGYNWQKAEPATLRDAAQWQADGANIGMRAARFPAVDIDCTDPALVDVIRKLAIEHLGAAPERQGRAPKSLLVYRTSESFGRMRLWLGGRKHLVEILGDGQQYVLAGMHPTTQKPYVWKTQLTAPDTLAEIDRDRAESFLAAVSDAADMMGYAVEREGSGGLSTDRDTVNQAGHVGELKDIEQAVAAIPNDNDHFAGRDDYLRMGYAIKAACGEAGYPIFSDWAGKWEGNENFEGNDSDTVREDWERMKPPFEVGANFIFDTARDFGHVAADEFEAIDRPAPGDEPDTDDDGAGAVEFSDAALASRFLTKHSHEVRYCASLGGWLVWTGAKWEKDEKQTVNYWAGEIGKHASREALRTIPEKGTANKVATRCASYNAMMSAGRYASAHPAITATPVQFDADPMLLNTPGGVVDLKTGLMREHRAADMLMKSTVCVPEAGRPEHWLAYLAETTAGDEDLQAYLQRYAGYCLTGLTIEHALAFMHGDGGNGKGTFINTLTAILDSYAKTAPMTLFMASSLDQHPAGVADLVGARLVQAQETDDNRQWAEAKIKSLTGGDPISARFMRENWFTYQPQFKLLFAGNKRPVISTLDQAMRRRFHLIPFNVKPKRVDNRLMQKLKTEHGRILQWAIEGALAWQRDGLAPPAVVADATAEYFRENDTLGRWLEENTKPAPGMFAQSRALFSDWVEWCHAANEKPGTEKAFVEQITRRGFSRKKQGGTGLRGFTGLRLLNTAGAEFQAA